MRTVKFADAAADADDAAAMGAAIAAHGPHPCAAAGGAGGTAGAAPIWQRQALYCTAIPGEPAPVVVVGGAPTRATTTAAAAAAAPKRSREEDAAAGDAMDADDGGATAQPTAKTVKAGAAAAPPPQLQPAFPPPAPGDCVVFVYPAGGDGSGQPAAHALPAAPRLNEIVEVWGVLSRTPDPGCLGGGCEGGFDDDDDGGAAALAAATAWGGLPPSSLVPRVHALFVRPAPALPPHHVAAAAAVGGPVSPLTIPPRSLAPPHPAAPAARAAAAGALAAALGGDALAAEYLLLQLVSRARAADVGGAGGVRAGLASLAPGVLALNLCGCPTAEPAAPGGAASSALSPFAARLAATLAALAPRCIALPVTVPALNAPPAGRFRPAACPATDRLRPRAPLQVAPATQVLLDETALAPGKLTPAGLDNARALQELLADKAVGYEFGAGARVPMPADAAVTVLSGAASSVLRSSVDLVLPLDPACAASAGAAAGAPPPLPPPMPPPWRAPCLRARARATASTWAPTASARLCHRPRPRPPRRGASRGRTATRPPRPSSTGSWTGWPPPGRRAAAAAVRPQLRPRPTCRAPSTARWSWRACSPSRTARGGCPRTAGTGRSPWRPPGRPGWRTACGPCGVGRRVREKEEREDGEVGEREVGGWSERERDEKKKTSKTNINITTSHPARRQHPAHHRLRAGLIGHKLAPAQGGRGGRHGRRVAAAHPHPPVEADRSLKRQARRAEGGQESVLPAQQAAGVGCRRPDQGAAPQGAIPGRPARGVGADQPPLLARAARGGDAAKDKVTCAQIGPVAPRRALKGQGGQGEGEGRAHVHAPPLAVAVNDDADDAVAERRAVPASPARHPQLGRGPARRAEHACAGGHEPGGRRGGSGGLRGAGAGRGSHPGVGDEAGADAQGAGGRQGGDAVAGRDKLGGEGDEEGREV